MTFSVTPPEKPVLAARPDLKVICLFGDEVRAFLNDILTAQIQTLAEATARPACLLTPQGRILFDMMVMVKKETVYLMTQDDQAGPLVKQLMMYRLRRKIDISQPVDLQVGHLWGGDTADVSVPEACVAGKDGRHADLGRLILFADPSGLPEPGTVNDWQAMRISRGIPEGTADLTPNRALLLEAGLHLLGAVDFDKGCYVGQEVTARTHYRGLVKRRLLPVISSAPLSPGQAIYRGDVMIGQTGSTAQFTDGRSVALASLRLDAVQAALAGEAELRTEASQPLSIHIPDWMPPLPGFDEGE